MRAVAPEPALLALLRDFLFVFGPVFALPFVFFRAELFDFFANLRDAGFLLLFLRLLAADFFTVRRFAVVLGVLLDLVLLVFAPDPVLDLVFLDFRCFVDLFFEVDLELTIGLPRNGLH